MRRAGFAPLCAAWCLWAGGMQIAVAEGFSDNFARLDKAAWHVANYDFSHPAFDTDWRAEAVSVGDGLRIRLGPQAKGLNAFTSGSVRRDVASHYGRYEVMMQPAKGDGLVTGFFTYTGPHYGTRHDEIDIEFMGRDTTKMHAAWFVDGALHERDIPLGFDAADRPRAYAFEWRREGIRWYAEGRLIFQISAAEAPIPSVPGRLFANLWAADGTIAGWAGRTSAATRAEARVLSVRFVPEFEGAGS